MAIVFSSQANLSGSGNILGDLADSFGIPGFPEPDTRKSGITSDIESVRNKMNDIVGKLMGKKESFDHNYVGSGKKEVIGSGLEGGTASPIEEANIRQVYSQTPQLSVIIRKRAFSSLSHLYDGSLMDGAEKWLLRATKRLIERKCFIMAEYERLMKVERMLLAGASTASVLASLISSSLDDTDTGSEWGESEKANEFTSAVALERIIEARQPVTVSTFFKDPESVGLEDLGEGSGAFEITTISDLNTSLDIDGNGSCSFTIEDPYKILFVTEEDIEVSLRETAPSNLQSAHKGKQVTTLLESAQVADDSLTASRKARGVSQITFSVSMSGSSGVSAVIDALGFELTTNNFDDVPEGYELNSFERTLFGTVMAGLKAYDQMVRLNILKGVNAANNSQEMAENMSYARKRMRLFYLGKSIIQPMDSINVFLAGGTRKSGEGEDVTEDNDIFSLDGAISTAASVLSHYREDGQLDQGPDEDLLREEWEEAGSFLTFEDFKKVRSVQLSTESSTHVFGGLVKTVVDKFDASSGKYTMSVQVDSNMEWLKISRYNSQPSLDQTQGLVYDPFTPFTYETDAATGLPTGEPRLLPENERLLNNDCRKIFHDTGVKRGSEVKGLNDLLVDVQHLGGNLKKMFHHTPGLKYRWKDGIMTAIYDMSTTNPLNGKRVDYKQLRRDVGLFTSNTPFDNMDAANIISVMVTGQPYNINSFIQSALNSGTFITDTSLNNKKSYFSSLLDIQNSFIRTHGSFAPYKYFAVDPDDLAKAILLQQRLTGKSSEMQRLQTQYAKLADKVANFSGKQSAAITKLLSGLKQKRLEIKSQLQRASTEFSELTKTGESLKDNVIQIAGNDISFDLADIDGLEDYRRFGDRLFHATLRRREDVIYNQDSNYLIVSDEYDKDYDIQAFVLQLRNQVADMWESSWQSVYQLCQTVAETLNFEFFCSSQGHLIFRPPQYNRTPASVLAAMLSFSKDAGITVFPEFLTKLFRSREESIINDINIIEWKIIKNAALLGKTSLPDIHQLIGSNIIFLKDDSFDTRAATDANAPLDPVDRMNLLENVRASNQETQAFYKGIFSAAQQLSLYKELAGEETVKLSVSRQPSEKLYETATQNIAKLSGQPVSNLQEYDKAKVGVSRNGLSTPATDIANLISDIAGLVSQRSKLLITLEKILDQNIEMNELNSDASNTLKQSSYLNVAKLFEKGKGVYNKLIEDDTRNVIGHLSGERFIIKDEHIINATFTEQPPSMTVAAVSGTEPIVGEGQGKIAGMPLYLAYGVDFDMWRQYGWRGQKPFEKPFFWSADKQCAPYAVMLLSRQRKNIITGTITVMGNEFYQLGDVVYVADRQLLYYVTKVSHTISYNGDFKTTLDLKYGHAPGEYIPTPLDVIGKLSTSKSKTQSAFRMRREKSQTNIFLGVVRFQKTEYEQTPGTSDIKKAMLNGKYGKDNFRSLVNSVVKAKREIEEDDAEESARIYVMTYAGDEDTQNTKREVISKWFQNPERPTTSGNKIGMPSVTTSQKNTKKLSDYKIDSKFIKHEHLRLCLPDGEKFTETENTLIKQLKMTASQEAIAFDETLENVVEIRLRRAPPGGWSD